MLIGSKSLFLFIGSFFGGVGEIVHFFGYACQYDLAQFCACLPGLKQALRMVPPIFTHPHTDAFFDCKFSQPVVYIYTYIYVYIYIFIVDPLFMEDPDLVPFLQFPLGILMSLPTLCQT